MNLFADFLKLSPLFFLFFFKYSKHFTFYLIFLILSNYFNFDLNTGNNDYIGLNFDKFFFNEPQESQPLADDSDDNNFLVELYFYYLHPTKFIE